MGLRGSDSNCKLKVKEETSEERAFERNVRENRRIDMADEFKMTLPIFDGSDYAMWKKRLTVFLKLKKCKKVIQRERSETENEAT